MMVRPSSRGNLARASSAALFMIACSSPPGADRDAGEADEGGALDAGYNWCPEPFGGRDRRTIPTAMMDDLIFEHDMTVLRVSQSEIVLDVLPDTNGRADVQVRFPESSRQLSLAVEGDQVSVLGVSCDISTDSFYIRIDTDEGQLIWEGGDPVCAFAFTGELLALEPIPDAQPCDVFQANPDPQECCCVRRWDMEVHLLADGDHVLVPGQDQVVTIDGASYVASAQGAYSFLDGPCSADYTENIGSAYIARLAAE